MSNGAGKGDLPRAVKGTAYRNNFDDIFRKKPTYAELLEKHDRAVSEGKFDRAAEYKQQLQSVIENHE